MNNTFCLTTTKTWAGSIKKIRIAQISFESNVIFMLMFADTSPFYKVFVYFFSDLADALEWNDSESSSRDCF